MCHETRVQTQFCGSLTAAVIISLFPFWGCSFQYFQQKQKHVLLYLLSLQPSEVATGMNAHFQTGDTEAQSSEVTHLKL